MTDFMVYVVDDDPGILESTRDTLRRAGITTREFSSAEEFIGNCPVCSPACLILDLAMPGMTGMRLIEWLRSRHIKIPVIVISGHGNIPAVVESMKLGVVEFLEKPADAQMLVGRVRDVLNRELTRHHERETTQEIRECFATLTGREQELIDLLADGLSSKQIAIAFNISYRTVENHRSHLLAKTGATNVASLIRMKFLLANHAAMD